MPASTKDTTVKLGPSQQHLSRARACSCCHDWMVARDDMTGSCAVGHCACPDPAGFGGKFREWMLAERPRPYGSWGNGSAMRASPIGWAAEDLDWALAEAERSAVVTHDHPDAVAGAQAVAAGVFLARQGESKEAVRAEIERRFGRR